MFPFTEIAKLDGALNDVESGEYESATGVVDKGVVWSSNSAYDSDPFYSDLFSDPSGISNTPQSVFLIF